MQHIHEFTRAFNGLAFSVDMRYVVAVSESQIAENCNAVVTFTAGNEVRVYDVRENYTHVLRAWEQSQDSAAPESVVTFSKGAPERDASGRRGPSDALERPAGDTTPLLPMPDVALGPNDD